MAFTQIRANIQANTTKNNFLVLTNTGGNGHLQTAKTIKAQIKEKYPDAQVDQIDIFEGFFGTALGKFFAERWNGVQRSGNILLQAFYISTISLLNLPFSLPIYIGLIRLLFQHNYQGIVNTQNMCITAIIKAVRMYNLVSGRNLRVDQIITDLPTDDTTIYFPYIRRLSKKDRSYLNIKTTKPLLDPSIDEETFWREQCRVELSDIEYIPLPIRPAFKAYTNKKKDTENPLLLNLSLPNPVDQDALLYTASNGALNVKKNNIYCSFEIQPEDFVSVMMLGAYPHKSSITKYLKSFIDIISRRGETNRRDIVFVFCAKPPPHSQPLQQKIIELIESSKNFPSNLIILPLPYQEDSVIAPLFHRSDLTLTRAGGITAMELLSVCSGKILIHRARPTVNLPKFLLNRKTILEGMPPWEYGNVRYLKAKKGAQIITPETFESISAPYFLEERKSSPERLEQPSEV